MFKKSAASYLFIAMTALGAASVASQANAQTSDASQAKQAVPATQMHKQGHEHGHKQGRQDRTHHQQHGKFWQGLDLTEAQRDEIFRIRHEQAPELRQQNKEVKRVRAQLAELTRADKFDDAAAVALANDLGKAQAQLALMHTRSRAKMAAVLTPSQREQLANKKANRTARGMHRDSAKSAPAAAL